MQVFSCYRGWKKACLLTRAISSTSRRQLSTSFSCKAKRRRKFMPFWQKLWGKAPLYATVKKWVAQFERGDFSTCYAPRRGWHKTVTTPEIIHQIHKLILEYRRIPAKSIAEQLGISRDRVWFITHEDLDMRKLSAKWVPKCLNADQKRQRCQSSEQFWKFFDAIQMISCCVWWPWTKSGYITMSQRQSNIQWSGGIAAHPDPKCKNPQVKFSPRFFGIKTASSSLIIFQRAKLSTWSITYLCWCNWRTFWKKNTMGRSPRGSCSCMMMPWLTGHLQTRRNWLTWASSVLITCPILQIWPRWTTTCSLDWKNNWKVAILRPTWRSLLPWRPAWTDLLNFFEWLAKDRAMG